MGVKKGGGGQEVLPGLTKESSVVCIHTIWKIMSRERIGSRLRV